jgi:RND family efflux transporter MFP subunit
MSRKPHRALAITGILLGASGLAVGLAMLKPAPEQKEIEDIPTLVDVLQLVSTAASFSIASQGTVRPRTETVLIAEVSGSIVHVSPEFVAGGIFAKGKELLRIDPAPYEAAAEQAEALLNQRQIEFDGAKSLRSQGYRAEAEYASAAAELATARAGLVTARRDLAKTRISLPYDGMVRAKEADIGQFVAPGSRLGVVFATDYAEVRLPLSDQDLAFVDLPRPGRHGLDDGPRVELTAQKRGRAALWPARITRSEGVVDENTRVTYAVARIDDPYSLAADSGERVPLPMGSFVTASIDGNTVSDVIRIPRIALRGRDQLLFVDEENRLRLRTVDVLRSDAEYAWLSGGASPGERISLTPVESPINGMKVRTVGDDDTTDDAVAKFRE